MNDGMELVAKNNIFHLDVISFNQLVYFHVWMQYLTFNGYAFIWMQYFSFDWYNFVLKCIIFHKFFFNSIGIFSMWMQYFSLNRNKLVFVCNRFHSIVIMFSLNPIFSFNWYIFWSFQCYLSTAIFYLCNNGIHFCLSSFVYPGIYYI